MKLGTHVLTGEKVAVKILEKARIVDVADVERVSREIHILKLLRHSNIIQLYEVCKHAVNRRADLLTTDTVRTFVG